MQLMRDVLWRSLAKSLSTLSPQDRLAAAWPVVAGHALAARSNVVDYSEGAVTIAAESEAWRSQLSITVKRLQLDLGRVSGTPVTDILVVLRTEPPHGGPVEAEPKRP